MKHRNGAKILISLSWDNQLNHLFLEWNQNFTRWDIKDVETWPECLNCVFSRWSMSLCNWKIEYNKSFLHSYSLAFTRAEHSVVNKIKLWQKELFSYSIILCWVMFMMQYLFSFFFVVSKGKIRPRLKVLH